MISGEVPGLLGTHSPTFAPYGGFRTADGWLVLAASAVLLTGATVWVLRRKS